MVGIEVGEVISVHPVRLSSLWAVGVNYSSLGDNAGLWSHLATITAACWRNVVICFSNYTTSFPISNNRLAFVSGKVPTFHKTFSCSPRHYQAVRNTHSVYILSFFSFYYFMFITVASARQHVSLVCKYSYVFCRQHVPPVGPWQGLPV